jgi:hypothetical protein
MGTLLTFLRLYHGRSFLQSARFLNEKAREITGFRARLAE